MEITAALLCAAVAPVAKCGPEPEERCSELGGGVLGGLFPSRSSAKSMP